MDNIWEKLRRREREIETEKSREEGRERERDFFKVKVIIKKME